MKTMKLTAVALALLAAALFTTSAKAAGFTQPSPVGTGDLVLGIYDSSATNTSSLEVNLGLPANLTNGETWNLSADMSSVFTASDGTSNNEFVIAGEALGVVDLTSTGTINPPSNVQTVAGNIGNELSKATGSNYTAVGSSGNALKVANGYTYAVNTLPD